MTRSTPARRAARPTDAPIRPVPTTARVRRGGMESAPHQLGHAECEIQGLTRVQAWIAEALVPRRQLLLQHRGRAAETLGHVLARELEVHAAGPGFLAAADLEERLDLRHD